MSIQFLDTSAVLNGGLHIYEYAYISPITLMELEKIKNSDRPENIKYLARQAVRDILASKTIGCNEISQHKIDKLLKKYDFLFNINDHRIICEAELLAESFNKTINFITSDGAQFLFAKKMPYLNANFYEEKNNEINEEEWCGWGRYYPNESEMAMLYSDSKMNILKARKNEFCEIYSGVELKDVLFWTGEEYRPLKYKDMKNPYLNEILKPRNLEQKLAFDLMQNKNIRVKLLTSAWGGGKTLIALTYALEQVSKGNFNKLLFVRNNIIVANTNDIGFLPGNLRDKMSIWGGPLADHLGGQEMLDQLVDTSVLEIFPLSHIRGRSIKDTIVICDECENMDDKLITLLMSRIEDGSELIFCGDVAQIDAYKFEKNNGIRSMIQHLSGDSLFGMVKLLKSERGPVAALCDKMRPPV